MCKAMVRLKWDQNSHKADYNSKIVPLVASLPCNGIFQ
jgi:hypothetical protein